ncbi:hypothetical protein LJR168_003764 [Pseudoxanthomonas sp. LjRoot168]|uniref:hypothetical protein n=1 Tax=unclassified Pseudoxanthomonas TaxID=2645906 RepID=UPI003ECE978A
MNYTEYLATLSPEERERIKRYIVPAPTTELVHHAPAMGLRPLGRPELVTANQTQLLLKAWEQPQDLPKAGHVQVIVFPPGADVPIVLVSKTDRTPTDARSGKLYQVEFAAPAAEDESRAALSR